MNIPSEEFLDSIKRRYPIGSRVKLVKMDDAQAPPIGTLGKEKMKRTQQLKKILKIAWKKVDVGHGYKTWRSANLWSSVKLSLNHGNPWL